MNTYQRLMALPQETRDNLLAELTSYDDYDMHERYDEMLNEVHGIVMLAGYEYETATLLKAGDRIAYDAGFADFTGDDDYWLEYQGNYYSASDVETALDAME